MEAVWIDQSINGIELRNFDMKLYNLIYDFLNTNFNGYFKWIAFDFKFFISDKCKGRSETIRIINDFTLTLNPTTT